MKKLFLLLFTVCCALTACSDGEGNDPKEIVLGEGMQTSQTVYADETAGKGDGIKFTTTGPWTAEVAEVVTRAAGSTVDWLKLNQYSGDKAGDYTLTLTLTENLTGSDRKAAIKIICGSTIITITVEQKGKKEDGTVPDEEPSVPSASKLLAKMRYTREFDAHENGSGVTYETEHTFTYDAQNRIIKAVEMDYDKTGKGESGGEAYWSYSDNTIIETYGMEDDTWLSESKRTYTLNNNRVESWQSEDKDIQDGVIRGEWKEKGTLHYDENGYLITANITSESNHGSGWETSSSTDFCEWQNGNLVRAGERESVKNITSVIYSDVDNTGNLDLNFFLANSEWMDCLVFSEPGIKPFGYIGKRSAKLMSKETDHYNNYYYTYDYKLNDDGTVATIKMVGYKADGTVEFRRNYTLTYMDAN